MTPSTPNQPAPAKPEHSALPWRRHDMEEDTIVSADGKAVAHVFGRSLTPENNEANLQTIRRAVNNHAEMLHALKLAHELLFRHPGTPEHGTAMTAINRAIRNATK